MAALTRVTQQLFGSGAGTDQIAQFGSLFAGSGVFTTNVATMMSLSNWLTGWSGAAIGGNAPAIEDMNAVCTVFAYQLGYILQAGVPEWIATTTYYTNSFASDGAGNIYKSIQNDNTNHALSNVLWWKLIVGDTMTALGDMIYGGTGGAPTALTGNTSATPAVLIQTGTGVASAAPAWRPFIAPTQQKFTSGSGTYTTPVSPVGPLYIEVEFVGGGGGGAGTTGASGNTDGGDTTFSTATAGKGAAGNNTTGGAGGTANISSFTGKNFDGQNGNGGYANSATINTPGGAGGQSIFGGAGVGIPAGQGGAAKANTGSGGAGAGTDSGKQGGGGGGAGAYLKIRIPSPSATYAYSVGAAGSGSTGGAINGGAGAAGIIIVTEYYQ